MENYNFTGKTYIEICDVTGRQVGKFNLKQSNGEKFSAEIDISNFTSGVYPLKFQNGSIPLMSKFIKQ